MNRNRTLQGQAVSIQSGIDQLTGTVTRTSDTSIWAVLNGTEYRFVESQDGQWRLYGYSADPSTAPLVFTDAPQQPADAYHQITNAELDELLAPVGWEPQPEPATLRDAVRPRTRIEFTAEQSRIADRIERINALHKGWQADDAAAREKVATGSLSSFRIEPLIVAAAREEPMRYMADFLKRIQQAAVISDRGRVLELTDPQLAETLVGYVVANASERYEGWHRPNSTSNVDVEIKLAAHEAWQSVMRVANGSRFY